jgi:valyl-tRNA synthetase
MGDKMGIELDTRFNSADAERRLYDWWEKSGFFHGTVNPHKQPFCLVIPPPNITGILHMGHVLDNTIQDIIVRFRRMQGLEATWVPGTDHAGIATQNVVERELAKQGLRRFDLGREKFTEKCWEWKQRFGDTIVGQLKRLGCACDWERQRFTMDEGLSNAVVEAFVSLYQKGLLYRGDYVINWCPRCLTALSDEEAEPKETEGGLYWVKYPLTDEKDFITVATTRPETMLGDTAIAVNPSDKRYEKLIGKTAILPIIGRLLHIVADHYVDPKFGTGAVKITPAHDRNDFELGQRHNLPSVVIMNPDGTMNENAGPYKGLDRLECRRRILVDLETAGLVEKKEKYVHNVGRCYRCDTVVEPYLSKQWFVKMKPLAAPAIEAVKSGRIKFYPERWVKVYLEWMENIRDWCISRQLWWGHRIPVWYCDECKAFMVQKSAPKNCTKCGSPKLRQDEDVLDTWFSSWLWPFSVLGWPQKTPEMKYFYPTSVLNSGKDIIFFWVSRMIMAGLEFTGEVPFKDVYFHGIARDEYGRKMSKSLGNSPDPILLIEKYGADALRFGIMANIPIGEDICLGEEVYTTGRNFGTKLWNATRLILMNLDAESTAAEAVFTGRCTPDVPGSKHFVDRWILSRLNSTTKRYTELLDKYEFSEAARTIYQFFWHELCDWYLELVKPRLYAQDGSQVDANDKKHVQQLLVHIITDVLKMLHPFLPFITEEIWQNIRKAEPAGSGRAETISRADWPKADEKHIDEEVEKTMELLTGMVRGVREIRNKMNIQRAQTLKLVVSTPDAATTKHIKGHADLLKQMACLESVEVGKGHKKPPMSATEVMGSVQLFVPLEGIIDKDKERKRLDDRIAKFEQMLEPVRRKLSSHEFRRKAPEAIVEKEQKKLDDMVTQLEQLKVSRNELETWA